MNRRWIYLLAVVAVTSMVVSASQTLVETQFSPFIYSAKVPGSGNYSAVKSEVTVGLYDGDLSAIDPVRGYPYGAYCVDPDQEWSGSITPAYMTTLNDAVALDNLNTKLGRNSSERNFNSDALTAQQRYQHAAYLTLQLDGNQANRGAIWGAIWAFTDVAGGVVEMPATPYTSLSDTAIVNAVDPSTTAFWLNEARLKTYTSGILWSDYALYSPFTNSLTSNLATYHQEFIGQVPEPGAYFLMGTAFLGVVVLVRRRRRMSGQAQV